MPYSHLFLTFWSNVIEKPSYSALVKGFLRLGTCCNLALTSFSSPSYSKKMRWERGWWLLLSIF